MIQLDVFTVRNSVCAKLPKPGLSNRTSRFPPVTRVATPPTMNAIASVAISELMRRKVTTRPLTTPTSRPAPIPSRIAVAELVWVAKCAAVTPANE